MEKKCCLCIFHSHQVKTCFTYFSFSLSEHPPSHPFAQVAFSSPSPLTVEREIDCLTISLSLSFLLAWTACSHLWITLLCIVELLNSTSSLFNCTRLLSLKQDTLTNVEKRGNKHNNEKLNHPNLVVFHLFLKLDHLEGEGFMQQWTSTWQWVVRFLNLYFSWGT